MFKPEFDINKYSNIFKKPLKDFDYKKLSNSVNKFYSEMYCDVNIAQFTLKSFLNTMNKPNEFKLYNFEIENFHEPHYGSIEFYSTLVLK